MLEPTPQCMTEPPCTSPVEEITCPKWGLCWPEIFVPDICPKCGTRVTETGGDGFEWHIHMMERIGQPWDLAACVYGRNTGHDCPIAHDAIGRWLRGPSDEGFFPD